jgi:hypothetical protein
VSRRFVHAARWHHSELPLKGYLLGVGSALLVLLFAANWLLPAPAPNPLIGSRVSLPPIRVYSETKAPDANAADEASFAMAGALTASAAFAQFVPRQSEPDASKSIEAPLKPKKGKS